MSIYYKYRNATVRPSTDPHILTHHNNFIFKTFELVINSAVDQAYHCSVWYFLFNSISIRTGLGFSVPSPPPLPALPVPRPGYLLVVRFAYNNRILIIIMLV